MKSSLVNELFNSYENYKSNSLQSDFIEHDELKNEIERLGEKSNVSLNKIGLSVDGKEIYSVIIGKGNTKVLAWSQMHGDEPTATAALFDLFNFFLANDQFDDLRNFLIDELEIHFIPMLNPDGAAKYQRENSFNIDLNRDALRLQSSESQILWDYSQKLKPEFGFNLHDQNSYYAAGRTNNTAAVSFLAPPTDFVKSINYTREKSMQVIAVLSEILKEFVLGNIARYSDDHEPRSFGDNLMRSGISTILIESGYYKNDENKNFVRKLNFISLIAAFNSIANKDYQKVFYADYFEIPENRELFFDCLIKNLKLKYNQGFYKVDVGINRTKKFNQETKEFCFEGNIAGLGDLSTFYGIEEYDLSNLELESEFPLAVDKPANFDLFENGIKKWEIRNGFLLSK